ncbi:SseB family protein [Sphingobium nicotianae]|uniref:SseB protein N-terminal domain-containing protein n=1 Tax=Sphingobium nicotianae TaxID=2782607 RepID=A0A9X1DAF8_9SPHN|nr:SseB family protein [Sphingobium nicotianae]MBT2186415.1 hypothetical protein [Sphingobium nicotianae]
MSIDESARYQPLTALEAAVRHAMAGHGDETAVLTELLASDICVPSASEVQASGAGLTPLLVTSTRFSSRMVLLFDDISRIGPELSAKAPYCLQVAGDWLIRSIAPDLGITLFVGPGIGCELSPALLTEARLR